MPKQYELRIRYDETGKLRMIASSEGYVMVRRSGARPFVMDGKAWLALPSEPIAEQPKTES
jgi:hypothetical protein